MIVRSAVKLVSNTRSKPSRRSAPVIAPAASAPAGSPNASPTVTETAGACCTTTRLAGSRSAARTSGMWLRSVNAPVGQTTTHWPQLMQLETFRPSSKAVPILAREPRPIKSIAPTPCTSSQTRTHLPHSTHLDGSRTIDGLDISRKWRLFSPA